jgi:MinD-like ATPase involved in chromosome partitioning or flagellar assembly
MLMRENGPRTAQWVSDMGIHAVASPALGDVALVKAVNEVGSRLRGSGDITEPTPADEDAEFEPEFQPEPDPEFEPVETPGRVIAVVSPKGGMGKTTVATNLAVGLARIAPMSVVLIDADAQFGDVATALSLDPIYTLPDAVSDAAAEDAMVLKTYLTPHPGGFYTVCGASSPIDGDRVTGGQISRLIAQLAGSFQYVIIDTAPGLGDHTLAALEQASDVVLLCGMSVTSARGLRNHLEVLSTIGITPEFRHVVLNFADRSSGLSVRDVEATTGVAVDIAIPRSKAVVLSSNRGIPVLQDAQRDPAAGALDALVRRFDPSAKKKRGIHRRVVVR